MKKYLIAVLLLFSLAFYVNVQAQTGETLTLTTYYPAPFGVYRELRLFPSAPLGCFSANDVGKMYYDSATNQVMVCRQTVVFPPTYAWGAIDSLWRLLGTALSPSNLSWNVGIGTTTPLANLHISAPVNTVKNLRIEDFEGNEGILIQTENGGERIRASDGLTLDVNGFFNVGPVGTSRLYITNTGNVGIGTTSIGGWMGWGASDRALSILGSARTWLNLETTTSGQLSSIRFRTPQTEWHVNAHPTNGRLEFWNGVAGQAMALTNSGNVGIGTVSPGSSPGVSLEIGRPTPPLLNGRGSLKLNNSGPSNVLEFRPFIYLNHIDTTTPPTDYGGGIQWQENSLAAMEMFYSSFDDGLIIWSTGPNVVFRRNGNVGIGTMSPAARLHVLGNFIVNGNSTVTGFKSFEIDHPTKQGMKLIHASVEGPEVAVFYRGQAQLINGEAIVELPDYFEALTRKEGRTAQLTPKGTEPYLLSASEVSEAKFKVHGTKMNGEFYWEVKAVRADIEPLRVEVKKEA